MAVDQCVLGQRSVPVGVTRVIALRYGLVAFVVLERHVTELDVLRFIGELHDVRRYLNTHIPFVTDIHAPELTFLRRHQHDAVRGTHTVDRRSRCIFEDGNRLDIFRRKEIDVIYKCSIHNV